MLSTLCVSQKGCGLIRDPTINPPNVRQLLSKIGNQKVTSLQLVREPLSTLLKTILQIGSSGKLTKYLRDANVDDLFHLSLIINDKYKLEKNQVINLEVIKKPIDMSKVESLDVPVKTNFTIEEMLKRTQKRMGTSYGPYDVVKNNCSIFLENVLSANDLLTESANTFLSQPVELIANRFPSLALLIARFLTDSAAVVDRVIQGEGKKQTIIKF